MSKVNFNLKNPKSEKSLIVARLRLNGSRFVYSTGMTIPTQYWNPRSQMPREVAEFEEAAQIILELRKLRDKIEKILTDCREEVIKPTPQLVRYRLANPDSTVHVQGQTLTSYIEGFIQRRENSPQFKAESIKVYKNMRNHLKKFSKRRNLQFEDLTTEYLLEFISYLWKKGFSDNYVNKI